LSAVGSYLDAYEWQQGELIQQLDKSKCRRSQPMQQLEDTTRQRDVIIQQWNEQIPVTPMDDTRPSSTESSVVSSIPQNEIIGQLDENIGRQGRLIRQLDDNKLRQDERMQQLDKNKRRQRELMRQLEETMQWQQDEIIRQRCEQITLMDEKRYRSLWNPTCPRFRRSNHQSSLVLCMCVALFCMCAAS
jgi:hypothetical protein